MELARGEIRQRRRRRRSVSSTFSNPASEHDRHEEEEEKDQGQNAGGAREPVLVPPPPPPAETKNERAHLSDEVSHTVYDDATYLVELTNAPGLLDPTARSRVLAKGRYDAILLVYDVGNRATFEAVQEIYDEIPLRHTKRGRKKGHATGTVRKSRSSIFAGAGSGGGRAAREPVVALVGNKSDFDDEFAGFGGGFDLGLVLSDKEAVLQEADVEERSLVHPLYRESRAYDDAPLLSPAISTRSTPVARARGAGSETAADARRSVLSADHALLGVPEGRWPNHAVERIRSGPGPLVVPRVKSGPPFLEMPGKMARVQSIEKWIETGSPGLPAETGLEEDDAALVDSGASDGEKTERTTALRRQVSRLEGEMLTRTLRLTVPFFETSAKTGENVDEVFEAVVREVLAERGYHVGGEKTRVSETRLCEHPPAVRAISSAGKAGVELVATETRDLITSVDEQSAPLLAAESTDMPAQESLSTATDDAVLEEETAEVVAEQPSRVVPTQRRESVVERFRRVFTKKTPAMVPNVA